MSSKRPSPAKRRDSKRTALPARPDLDQLRVQSKQLLARLRAKDSEAVREFIAHLPEAQALSPARVATAGFRLADAQSVVARRSGFASWPALARHVSTLHALEGEWAFRSLEVEGSAVPQAMLDAARILIDGDRFRTESAEADYDGEFIIDVEAEPCTIDIQFVEGPEAGNRSLGIFTIADDHLTICLGLTGAPRPRGFRTTAGSGHALETLRRVSPARPAGVTGGHAPTAAEPAPRASTERDAALDTSTASFTIEPSALDVSLAGSWSPLELVRDGTALPETWLPSGRRVLRGVVVQVTFGGQVMVHARVRHDGRQSPAHVDYLHLSGAARGLVTHGICELRGEELWVNMSAPGAARPTGWDCEVGSGRVFSRWRRSDEAEGKGS